jgi:hypothetical protein
VTTPCLCYGLDGVTASEDRRTGRGDQGWPYAIDVSITPKVAFENGKAVTASLNWGKATGPMLVYALIYAGTGLDNATNFLGPEVVRVVNEFTGKKWPRVRNELSGSKEN